jgi:predicted lipoprotein with Yx(FWY)xxD motif
MKRLALLLPFAAAALLAAGCGSGGDGDGYGGSAAASTTATTTEEKMASETTGAGASKAARGTRVKLVGSEYGRVISDGKGEALYLFDKESTKRSQCYGACARAWPPLLTKGKPRAGKGVKGSLLGTTRRKNGKLQVTYGGQPLYYYVDDSPGTILCHDVSEFGGLWLVVKPNGKAA